MRSGISSRRTMPPRPDSWWQSSTRSSVAGRATTGTWSAARPLLMWIMRSGRRSGAGLCDDTRRRAEAGCGRSTSAPTRATTGCLRDRSSMPRGKNGTCEFSSPRRYRFGGTFPLGATPTPSTPCGRPTLQPGKTGSGRKPTATGNDSGRAHISSTNSTQRHRSRLTVLGPCPPAGRNQRLEPGAGKLACPVLRGPDGGNAVRLPGSTGPVTAAAAGGPGGDQLGTWRLLSLSPLTRSPPTRT
jgi:hypothetical protein